MLLDVPKNVYTFNIAGKTDYGIEQCLALRGVNLQYSIEFLDINGIAILTLLFITFHKETATVVNLKACQRIENDVIKTGIAYKLSVFVFKAMLDIFCISNGPLVRLDEFVLTFGIKSEKG